MAYLLKFVDLVSSVFVLEDKHILSDLIGIENNCLIEKWDNLIFFGGAACYSMIVQVYRFHDVWVQAVKYHFVQEDFVHWYVLNLYLQDELVLYYRWISYWLHQNSKSKKLLLIK